MAGLHLTGEKRVPVRLVDVGVGVDARTASLRLCVSPAQAAFVAPVAFYLAMCDDAESPWRPFAVERDGAVVGFVMTAVDPTDNSMNIGGLIIDVHHQRRGTGTATVHALIERARTARCHLVALAYAPENAAARAVYARLGFVETGEKDGNEVIAQLDLCPPDSRRDYGLRNKQP
ncbi:MAG: GNAT family N-acetyltransferase [Candidatus Nanopelagicales bacterium]